MQDRVAAYPGRVKLVPVAGQTNVYDMTLADSPTVVGTPLNKANLLTDATAALLGLTSSATVNDAFLQLKNSAVKIETGSYTGTGVTGEDNPNGLTFGFVPKLVIIVPSTLVSPSNMMQYLWGASHFKATGGAGTAVGGSWCPVTISGKTMSWYSASTSSAAAGAQFNVEGVEYQYFAIG